MEHIETNHKNKHRHAAGATRRTILISAALLFAFACAFVFTGCGDDKPVGADVSKGVAGVAYYHYDPADFNGKCDKLEELAAGEDADAIIKTYDELYAECEELETLYSVVYVMYAADVTNDYYSDEQLYSYDKLQKCSDRLCGICRQITEGPCAEQFKKHVGDDAFREFAEYEVMTKREKKLVKEEKKLVDEYYNIIDASDKDTYKYKGKEWTFEMISGEAGEELSISDYDGYVEIYDGLLKKTNDKAGPIYLKLVKIRSELADIEGYDNFAAYADEEEYCRDYTEDDIEQLHKDVKKISQPYFDNYYSSAESDGVLPHMSTKKLLSNLQKYSALVDDMASDSAQQMIDENLISIGDEDGRQDGAFTTYIRKTNRPFISMTLDVQRDFIVLSHEFGHFVEYNNETPDNILTDKDNIDLAEIASNGFEGLLTNYYDDIFKSSAETARKDTIGELLENVIDGCVEDEFQRAIYKNPDMTLDEVNELYSDIYAEYNSWAEGDPGYSWVYIGHTFESPMYYISYTVSALAALQIWNQSNKNFDKAVNTWEKIIAEGTYNQTYLDVIGKCGLIKFTEKGAVKKICKPALKATSNELDFDYDFTN